MSVNKAILIGKLGKDPEINYTANGTAVCKFSLATDENYKDRDGNRQSKTEWHNIVVWGKLAEVCERWLSKGKQVYIEGKITTNKWQDRDGNTRYTTEIVANNMTMLGSKSDVGSSGGGQQYQPQQPTQPAAQPAQHQYQPTAPPAQQQTQPPPLNPDDDIPF